MTKYILLFLFISISLIVLLYILSFFVNIPKKIKTKLPPKHLYIVFFILPIFYIIYYNFLYDETKPETYIISSKWTLSFLHQSSLVLLGSGIFSATSKYINSLVVFKDHFENVILSDKFNKKITSILASVPFSDEHLSQVEDIQKMWKKITLFKFKKVFPELMNKLEPKLTNELLTYSDSYYKNFKIQINIKLLEDNIVKINEINSVTLIPKDKEPITVNFWVSIKEEDGKKLYSKFLQNKTKINGTNFEINNKNAKLIENKENGLHTKHYEFKLDGSSEYHIEREIEMTQDLNSDRLYTFASSKVIDDISVHIQFCEKLNVIFSSVNDKIFREDNLLLPGKSYINRDVMLPGDVFNLFILKNNL